MELDKKIVAKMIASAGSGQPKVGNNVFFSCKLAEIPDNPSLEFHARLRAKKWGWIDDYDLLTRKGFENLEASE